MVYEGLELKQQLVISSSMDSNLALIVTDKNLTSCISVESCMNNGKSSKLYLL